MQFSHEVVALQHSSHIEGKGERHCHRQSLGHCHHYQRHGHHEVFQHHLGHLHPFFGVPQRIGHDVVTEESHEGQCRHCRPYLADELRQSVELHVQWRLHGGYLGALRCHLSDFGRVAHGGHLHPSVSVHHHCRAQRHIRGICRPVVLHLHKLGYDGFAREGGFVYLQVGGLKQCSVGRHFVAHGQHHDVAHHDVPSWYLHNMSLSHHLHRLLLAQGSEFLKSLCCIPLEIESHCRCEEYGEEYADSLHIVVFDDGKGQ